MRVIDDGQTVRFLLRSPLENLIVLHVADDNGLVWGVVSNKFQPASGEMVSLHGPVKITTSQLPPEQVFGEQNVPEDQFTSSITYAAVPSLMWQQVPEGVAAPLLIPGTRYAVFARNWEGIERAQFVKV